MRRLIFILSIFVAARAEEFLYPVVSLKHDGENRILLLYQKSVDNVELWLWDPVTKTGMRGLLSLFVPSEIRSMGDGFSFLDEGRVRVKSFYKRSPKTIDLYEPIYNISFGDWIDKNNFYFSAKDDERFKIFKSNLDGEVEKLVGNDSCDCMYPQILGNKLFYIERKDGQYKVKMGDATVCHFGDKCVAFLKVVSEREWYVAEIKGEENDFVYFGFYCLDKELFSFKIPKKYFINETRLYESILPLLPRVYNNGIYFINYLSGKLAIYFYEFKSNKSILKTRGDQSFFSPVTFENKIFYGGEIGKLIKMWHDNEIFYFDLPYLE